MHTVNVKYLYANRTPVAWQRPTIHNSTTEDHMLLLGILNITPDSFFDGSLEAMVPENAIARGLRMHTDGADVIDVGGESTRPGFAPVDEREELHRVLPVVVQLLNRARGIRVSIDTRKPAVAEMALRMGATIVNAYGGMDDPDMAAVIRTHRPTVIAYHTDDVRHRSDPGAFDAIRSFCERQEILAREYGLAPKQLLCDPGIGFGKSLSQTVCILRRLAELTDSGRRCVCIGVSRKSHLGLLLKRGLGLAEPPGVGERLEAGLAATAIAVMNGATAVRTHDVRATRRFLATLEVLMQDRLS